MGGKSGRLTAERLLPPGEFRKIKVAVLSDAGHHLGACGWCIRQGVAVVERERGTSSWRIFEKENVTLPGSQAFWNCVSVVIALTAEGRDGYFVGCCPIERAFECCDREHYVLLGIWVDWVIFLSLHKCLR